MIGAHDWITDVIAAADTLGYRVVRFDWENGEVVLEPLKYMGRERITISGLFTTGAYLLSHLRPLVNADELVRVES